MHSPFGSAVGLVLGRPRDARGEDELRMSLPESSRETRRCGRGAAQPPLAIFKGPGEQCELAGGWGGAERTPRRRASTSWWAHPIDDREAGARTGLEPVRGRAEGKASPPRRSSALAGVAAVSMMAAGFSVVAGSCETKTRS